MENEDISNELKQIELKIFLEFKKICDMHNIKYFICGGTLLGAVRHKGFIPWDDDIDILMLRDEYEKFIKIAHLYLPDYYFLQNIYTEREFYCNYSKIRDTRTTFIENSVKKLNINHGVFIDIFPLDIYPKSRLIQVYIKIIEKFANSIIFEQYEVINGKSVKEKITSKFSHVFFKTAYKATMCKEKLYKNINKRNGNKVKNYSGAWGDKEIHDISYFKEQINLEFEGIYVSAPKKFDQYLRNVYGNYMIYPPIEKQVSHHNCYIIDLKRSYKQHKLK